ncbi:putative t-complex protein 1 subunit beta protein [Teratosphaeria destructans]|uniref:T-complex protein 1 subunit beta protein n=1 Tax=Teratosphaeria destructans TaxID=418781 RepID=A0A9W7SVL6_9PEZI|nr:putative t-complex protein 1 subunit beta protein [Teratosphaeria destructans]
MAPAVTEEVLWLRCRNTALETEIRLIREQLAQAQAGTNYLVTALSTQEKGRHSAEVIDLRAKLDAASAENTYLKAVLRSDSRPQLDVTSPAQRPVDPRLPRQVQQLYEDSLRSAHEGLSFPSAVCSQAQSLDEEPDDLLSFDQCSVPSIISDDKENISPSLTENVHKIVHSDGSTSFIVNTESEDPLEILPSSESPKHLSASSDSVPVTPALLPSSVALAQEELLPLAPWQHKLLLNNCCFLEDMDEAERQEKFEHFAKERGGSARSWEHHFREIVWPQYLAKKQKVEAVVSNDSLQVTAGAHESVAEGTIKGFDGETLNAVESPEQDKTQNDFEFAPDPASEPESVTAPVDGGDALDPSREAPLSDAAEATLDGLKEAGVDIDHITDETQDVGVTAPQHVTERSSTQSSTQRRPFRGDSRGEMLPSCCKSPYEVAQLFHSSHEHDPAGLRTVQISNLPSDITLAKVLEKVRGGKIFSATYIETSKLKVKPLIRTDLVFVTFLDAKAAKSFAEDAAKNWICYFFEKWDQPIKATVSLLQAPARQISPRELDSINYYDHTRILYIVDKNTISPTKAEDLLMDFDTGKNGMHMLKRAIKSERNQRGALVFEYASIVDAVNARSAVGYMHWEFGGMEAGFLPDPCDTSSASRAEIDASKRLTTQVDAGGAMQKALIPSSPAPANSASHYTTDSLDASLVVQNATPKMAARVPRVNPWATSGSLALAKEMSSSFKTNYARGRAVLPPHARVGTRLLTEEVVKGAAEGREEDVVSREGGAGI